MKEFILKKRQSFSRYLLHIWESLSEILNQLQEEITGSIVGYGLSWAYKKAISLFKKKPVLQTEIDNPDQPLINEYLRMISQLYLHPFFTIHKESQILIDCFYDVTIDVTRRFSVEKDLQPYFIGNFCFSGMTNREQLVTRCIDEKRNPERNDSRYMMGFRSIWFILNQNRHKLDVDYTAQLVSRLDPFFSNFKHKEYLK